MRIVHVVRQFWPGIGGLEEAIRQLASHQVAAGHAVRVVTLDRLFTSPGEPLPPRECVDGIEIVRIGWHGSSRYPIAPAVLRAIAGADLVHVHAIDFFFDFLARSAPFHRRPLVASTHGGFFHTPYASRLKRVWFRTITRGSARAYRAICASSRADLAMFAPICPANLHLVENGVDITKWRGASALSPRPTLLCLGRFSRHKNIPALMPIMAYLVANDPRWRLIIAGNPTDVTEQDLRVAAEQHGVSSQVEIHVAAADARVRELIGRASYMVSASRHEGFGLGIVEGLSAGLFPVLNDIPAFRTLHEMTGRGFIADFARSDQVAEQVIAHFAALQADHAAQRDANITSSESYGWGAASALTERIYEAVIRA